MDEFCAKKQCLFLVFRNNYEEITNTSLFLLNQLANNQIQPEFNMLSFVYGQAFHKRTWKSVRYILRYPGDRETDNWQGWEHTLLAKVKAKQKVNVTCTLSISQYPGIVQVYYRNMVLRFLVQLSLLSFMISYVKGRYQNYHTLWYKMQCFCH